MPRALFSLSLLAGAALSAWVAAVPMIGCSGGSTVTATSGVDAGTDAAATTDVPPPDQTPGGPIISSVATSAKALEEGGTVTFTAVVTHPEGTQALVGGNLKSAKGDITYGPFIAASGKGGSYSIDLSWTKIDAGEPITFTDQGSRNFTAEFVDENGRRSTRTVSLGFDCSAKGGSACDGACMDLRTDSGNCGACGKVCPPEAKCGASKCMQTGLSRMRQSCDAICGALRGGSYACEPTCTFGPTFITGAGPHAGNIHHCEFVNGNSCAGAQTYAPTTSCTAVPPEMSGG